MLTRLGLRNFKAFGDEMQYADLAPITLIYGPNSGGKSSIIQALLMLKQSHEAHETLLSSPHLRPLTLVTNGNLVNLGNYSSLIHNHDSERTLEVDIAYEQRRGNWWSSPILFSGRTKWDDVLQSSDLTDMEFGICSSIAMTFNSIQSKPKLVKVGYEFTSSIGGEYKIKFNPAFNPADDEGIITWHLDSDSVESIFHFIQSTGAFLRKVYPTLAPFWRRTMDGFIKSASDLERREGLKRRDTFEWQRFSQFSISSDHLLGIPFEVRLPPHAGDNEWIDVELDELYHYKMHLDRLSYLGPLMAPPQRYYDMKEQSRSEHTIGVGGENVPQVLMDKPHLNEEIDEWLRQFDVPYKINAEAVSSSTVIGNELVAIYLTHQSTDTPVTLADVGFGINQMLPVILQGVTSSQKIICVEQPEIHLHPRLQANIADFLIETSRVDKKEEWVDGKKRIVEIRAGNQWIVETHSEMIIRRLQTRIREGAISSEDVSVLYVDPQDDGSSTIQRLRLDENGYWLDDWPDGFFDESVEEARSFRRARKVRN